MQTQVIHGSRWKAALIAMGGFGFVALLLMLAATRGVDSLTWFGGGFFGLCGVVGLIAAVRPSTLTLTIEGFEHRDAFGRRINVRWNWIASLELWRNPVAQARQTLVAWRLRPGAPRPRLGRINVDLFDIDGALPGLLSMGPLELLEVMQTWHSAATANDGGNGAG